MKRSYLVSWVVVVSVVTLLSGQTMAGEGGDEELAQRLTGLGIAAQMQSDHEAALAYFDRARREVDHPKVRYFQAKSLDALARYDAALAEFQALDGEEAVVKYAGEIKAYIRAILAEREKARLVATIAQLQKNCPAPVATPAAKGSGK